MTATFRINYPASRQVRTYWSKEYGLNAYYSGKHWSRRNQDKNYWHQLTWAMAKNVPRFENAVKLTFKWNDGLDLSNHAVMAKMIEDALVLQCKIGGDSKKWVKEIKHQFHKEPYIEVTIEDYEQTRNNEIN